MTPAWPETKKEKETRDGHRGKGEAGRRERTSLSERTLKIAYNPVWDAAVAFKSKGKGKYEFSGNKKNRRKGGGGNVIEAKGSVSNNTTGFLFFLGMKRPVNISRSVGWKHCLGGPWDIAVLGVAEESRRVCR